MIIIPLHFDGGSTGEEHDIAHIASSIVARLLAGFFLSSAFFCAEYGITPQRLPFHPERRGQVNAISIGKG
ncbi:hypothetical protein [Pantoea sp. USHLN298]|uniref:hypothetical protein n=1 Tax=Pantoea sp. USHLN298 TaxID=3081294 RepID=UPI003015FE94